jgi:hypothetical protein
MNIIDAAKRMTPKKKLVSEYGFVAVMDDEGMLLNSERENPEPFGFYIEELLSTKWTVEEEECEN